MLARNPKEALEPIINSAQINSWNAFQGADAIVAGGIGFWGIDIAERLNIPCFFAVLQPASPTQEFLATAFPPRTQRFGGLCNSLTHTITS